jgi:hypothetical protein
MMAFSSDRQTHTHTNTHTHTHTHKFFILIAITNVGVPDSAVAVFPLKFFFASCVCKRVCDTYDLRRGRRRKRGGRCHRVERGERTKIAAVGSLKPAAVPEI